MATVGQERMPTAGRWSGISIKADPPKGMSVKKSQPILHRVSLAVDFLPFAPPSALRILGN